MEKHKNHCPTSVKGGSGFTCTCYRATGQPKSFHANYDKFPVELDPNLGLHSAENL
ncbi:hypothetical protein FDH66_gp11 [Arthrobacter phage Amigo]|uniref:Uncharacterized protein n=2 Tax=Amigovirus amigo TaxID=1982100 RepID=A0A0U4IST6_9CAUD|nr:hypothetical protein FDH66_gp11 [Arthrobacter phage Amigo]ALY08375.1 hypothetical protein AMIGO_11 [Arthrobacter phage Amigo]QJD51663.1 hypothetical protein SEA_BOERSMA_12 [Arthrobacter phage Boersma]